MDVCLVLIWIVIPLKGPNVHLLAQSPVKAVIFALLNISSNAFRKTLSSEAVSFNFCSAVERLCLDANPPFSFCARDWNVFPSPLAVLSLAGSASPLLNYEPAINCSASVNKTNERRGLISELLGDDRHTLRLIKANAFCQYVKSLKWGAGFRADKEDRNEVIGQRVPTRLLTPTFQLLDDVDE